MTTAITQPDRGEYTSASNAAADALCAGRHNAQKGIPDVTSDDAAFGNMLHGALAVGSPEGLDARQEDLYLSCLEIEKKVLVQFFGQEIAGITPKPACEKRHWVAFKDGLRHSAQIDRVHRKGTKVLIIELKSLTGEIPESPKNLQLRDQAVVFDASNSLVSEIGVVVIQPLVTHSPELCVYGREDLNRAANELHARVKASNDPNAKRTAGEVQCKFCRASAQCPEYNAWASQMLPAPKTLVDVPVASWTPEQRTVFCNNYDVAQKWLDKAWAEMEKGAATDPSFVPGYALVPNSPRSKIVNLDEVFQRMSALGVTSEQFIAKTGITKEALTELVRTASKKKGKELTQVVTGVIGQNLQTSEVKSSLKKV